MKLTFIWDRATWILMAKLPIGKQDFPKIFVKPCDRYFHIVTLLIILFSLAPSHDIWMITKPNTKLL